MQSLETTPNQMLQMAINKDLDIEKLKVLIEMQRAYQEEQAKKAFTKAFSEFQKNCPILEKLKENNIPLKSGGTMTYNSLELADIDVKIKEPLSNAGLTKDWEITQENGKVKVTCIVTHYDGYQKKVSLIGPHDETGGKNAIQAIGSTLSYLMRYTLMMILGLTARGMDDDGHGSSVNQETPDRNKVVMNDKMFTHYSGRLEKGEITVADIVNETKDHALITDSQMKAFQTIEKHTQKIPL